VVVVVVAVVMLLLLLLLLLLHPPQRIALFAARQLRLLHASAAVQLFDDAPHLSCAVGGWGFGVWGVGFGLGFGV
jgi:hypothetical protein